MFRKWLLPWIVIIFYRALSWTWRIDVFEPESLKEQLKNNDPLIMAHWHGDELALFHLVKRYKLSTMTSTSPDGELVDRLLKNLGGKTSKGSSTRGGVTALKGLVRLIREGHPASIAVDGPKGPIYEIKPGVFELSRLCQANIFPVGVATSHKHIFKRSWNQTYLPLPFAKVQIVFGPGLKSVHKRQDPKESALKDALNQALADVRQQARKQIAPT